MSSVEYVGKDLEAMSFAVNYHRWILSEYRPFLGRRLVEVGAGTGSFSNLLLEEGPETLTLVEPSDMYGQLAENVRSDTTAVDFRQNIFANVADEIAGTAPDSIFYTNVLEHIEDDAGELRLIHKSLASRGRVFIFVPALQQLYGNFDRQIGHFRRYSKPELVAKVEGAGFRVLKARYFDLIGVVPWFVTYRLLGSSTLNPTGVSLYDRIAVPVNRVLESLIKPPLGKNILLVGEKT